MPWCSLLHSCIWVVRISLSCSIQSTVPTTSRHFYLYQVVYKFWWSNYQGDLKRWHEAMLAQGSEIPLEKGNFCLPSHFLLPPFLLPFPASLSRSTVTIITPFYLTTYNQWRVTDQNNIKRQFITIHLKKLITAYLAGSFQTCCIWEFIVRQQCQIIICEIS